MAESVKSTGRSAFSGWPMVLAWLGMLIFAFHSCTHMVGAGDTWVAMACGRHFVNHGVDTVEPFSANSHRAGPTQEDISQWPPWAQWITEKVGLDTVRYWHPTGWVNQNWLTHVLFYKLATALGSEENPHYNALVYWKFAIYILAVICVYYTGRLLGVNGALSAVFACFAMFVGRSYFDIRPAGFSNLLVAVFLLLLVLTSYRNVLYIWLLVPLAVLWCNLHGGYIYLLIMLVPFVGWHISVALSKRWTALLYGVVTWIGLYGLTVAFLSHQHLESVVVLKDWLFYLVIGLIALGLVIASSKKLSNGRVYAYLVVTMLLVFIVTVLRFSVKVPAYLDASAMELMELREYVQSWQILLIVAFVGLLGLGFVFVGLKSFLQRNFMYIAKKGVLHCASAGFVSFVGIILLNPFHLTNLTHTFIISFSEHAKMWRTVNEWHPAFEWSNPVGTSFPFLVLVVMSAGLLLLWLFSRLLLPRFVKAPKNELQAQRRFFDVASGIFGWAAAILAGWVVFISFSFLALDVVSFLLCGLFVVILLLSAYRNVHWVHAAIPLTLAGLWLAGEADAYRGRYIYPFVLVPGYVLTAVVARAFSQQVEIKRRNIVFVLLAAVAGVVLMAVFFNPFGFESSSWNVKAGLEKWLDLKRIWHPLYEGNDVLKYGFLFRLLYVINGICVGLWLLLPQVQRLFKQAGNDSGRSVPAEGRYKPASIDAAIVVIAALTVYMAIRSRRFIPIAAITACPVVAMFIQQVTETLAAAGNFHKVKALRVGTMPRTVELFFAVMGLGAVLGFGLWWGLKFKRVYLDSWPTDVKLTSIFMRMTASDAKPFYACQFIRKNKLAGKMYNYWTEGGFIAWGQEPDARTGRTALQLFMDGRAQAAYEPKTYRLWSEIMSGGPLVQEARARRRKLTNSGYAKVGQWISERLKKYKVWLVLMPAAQFDSPLVRGLNHDRDWQLVFFNNKQKLFVDITTEPGNKLFDGISRGETVYPDEFSKKLIMSHNMFFFGKGLQRKREALNLAIEAFEILPSQAPMQELLFAQNFPELRQRVTEFCQHYIADLTQNGEKYARQDGYHHRVVAGLIASSYLQKVAKKQQDTESLKFYAARERQYNRLRNQMLGTKRW